MKTVRTLGAFLVVAALAAAARPDDTKPPTGGSAPSAAPNDAKPAGASPAEQKKADAKPAGDTAATSKAPAEKTKPATPPVAAAPSSVIAPRSLGEALRMLERRRADIDFREMAMDDVVSFLSKVGRVNAIVAPEFRLKAAGPLPSVTLKLTNVNLRQVADLVAKTTGAALVLRDGVLQFTTPEDARGKPILRVFTIAELTFAIRNFPGPDIRLHTGGVRYVQEEETDRASPFDDPDQVVELLKKFTGEGTWDDADVSISADKNKLVVRQYPAVLKEIAAFLAVLRAAK